MQKLRTTTAAAQQRRACEYKSILSRPHAQLHQNSNRIRNLLAHLTDAAQTEHLAALKSACSICKADIGINPQGYRGLLALTDLAAGDVAVSVPLYNILQVPRQLHGASAAAAVDATRVSLAKWQQQHGPLPHQLLDLMMDPNCPWEAKLVSWLLHLQHTAEPGSCWHSYCAALPTLQETVTFFCYNSQQAEQLQFSAWKALAAKQRELLLQVQQACNSACSSSSSSSAVNEHTVLWALSMVKSRTFGRQIPQQQTSTVPQSSMSVSASPPAGAAAAADELQQGSEHSDDSSVVLLMVPYVDMINHALESNCVFGVNWQTNSFDITCSTHVPAGAEITICYGSNKSNLALQSCYGFYIPGNPGDAQLLQPIFNNCLAAAGAIQGFDAELLAAAAAKQQQQHGQGQGPRGEVKLAYMKCAQSAFPVAATAAQEAGAAAGSHSSSSSSSLLTKRLQLQKYLAQLILYQIQQSLRVCGTTAAEDAAALHHLDSSSSSSMPKGSEESKLAAAVERSAVALRLEQKLLLHECRILVEELLNIIEQRLQECH